MVATAAPITFFIAAFYVPETYVVTNKILAKLLWYFKNQNFIYLELYFLHAPFPFLFIRFSPSCLLLKGREEDAALALQWLRGENTDISQVNMIFFSFVFTLNSTQTKHGKVI